MVSFLTSVSAAGVDLPVSNSMRVLGVILDPHLTIDNVHVSRGEIVQVPYHARAIRHIRHLLTLDLAQMLTLVV
jgi:hypothetical protein